MTSPSGAFLAVSGIMMPPLVLFGLDAADENTIMKRVETPCFPPWTNIDDLVPHPGPG